MLDFLLQGNKFFKSVYEKYLVEYQRSKLLAGNPENAWKERGGVIYYDPRSHRYKWWSSSVEGPQGGKEIDTNRVVQEFRRQSWSNHVRMVGIGHNHYSINSGGMASGHDVLEFLRSSNAIETVTLYDGQLKKHVVVILRKLPSGVSPGVGKVLNVGTHRFQIFALEYRNGSIFTITNYDLQAGLVGKKRIPGVLDRFTYNGVQYGIRLNKIVNTTVHAFLSDIYKHLPPTNKPAYPSQGSSSGSSGTYENMDHFWEKTKRLLRELSASGLDTRSLLRLAQGSRSGGGLPDEVNPDSHLGFGGLSGRLFGQLEHGTPDMGFGVGSLGLGLDPLGTVGDDLPDGLLASRSRSRRLSFASLSSSEKAVGGRGKEKC